MKILLLNELYYPNEVGGAEKSTKSLADALVKKGNEVHVICSSDKDYVDNIEGVTIHYVKTTNLYWSFQRDHIPNYKKIIWHVLDSYNYLIYWKLNGLLSSIKPDVIHTNVVSSFSVIIWSIAKRKFNIPIVHTLRDYYLLCSKSDMFKNGSVCKERCQFCVLTSVPKRQASQLVDAVVGISQYILDRHKENEYFMQSKFKLVIPNSVNISYEFQKNKDSSIGYLGRISPSKGIERLIDDFLKVKTNLMLLIAGNGPESYLNSLKSKYIHPRVHFIGRVSPHSFFSKIGLLVVPSEWDEPFGRVVIESISMGCPVIVSNRGGLIEIVNSECGRVFEIEDKFSLIKILQEFADGVLNFDTDKILAQRLNYLPDEIANKYINLYHELL